MSSGVPAGTVCNQTAGSLPLPSSTLASLALSPRPLWFTRRPSQPFSQHTGSATSRHRLSFICALSQRRSLVKEAACCQVPSLYSRTATPQRHPSEPDFSFLLFVRTFIYLIRYESETKEEQASKFAISTWGGGWELKAPQ